MMLAELAFESSRHEDRKAIGALARIQTKVCCHSAARLAEK
jgi:hypothetical protein